MYEYDIKSWHGVDKLYLANVREAKVSRDLKKGTISQSYRCMYVSRIYWLNGTKPIGGCLGRYLSKDS